jgi:hypothetical protein
MTAFPEKATPQSSPEDQRGSRKNMIDGPVWWRKIADLFLTHKNTWIVFFLLAFMYAYFYHEPGYNGNSRLSLTAAIAEEGRLAIDSFHEVSGYATEDKSEYNGHYYSDKAIGSSLIAAPLYALIYWSARLMAHITIGPWLMTHLLTFLVIGLWSALAGALIYRICEHISGSPLRAGVVTAALALGSLAFPFSVVFFGHQLVAAQLWVSFFLIFRLRLQENPPGRGYALLIGLLLGLCLITEYPTAVIVLALVAYYLYILWLKRDQFRMSTLVLPALGGLAMISLMLGYNFLAYGEPLVNGYQYLVDPYFKESMSHGLMGIGMPSLTVMFFQTFQPAMGLFWQSPALLMIFPGAFYILRDRRYRVEGILAVFIFIVYITITSGYYQWWGGYSAGPRHIIPILPFLCWLLIFLPRRLFPWFSGLTAISVAQMLIIAASEVIVPAIPMENFQKLGFFEYSTIYSFCLPELMNGKFTWNLGIDLLGLNGWASLVPVVLAITGVLFYFWRISRNRPGVKVIEAVN